MSGSQALNFLSQDFVSHTEEKGGLGKGCHEFSRRSVFQSEGDGLEEKLVGMRTGEAQRLSERWESSDPGGVG